MGECRQTRVRPCGLVSSFPCPICSSSIAVGKKDHRQGRQGDAQGAGTLRKNLSPAAPAAKARTSAKPAAGLQEVKAFGSNPGRLRMLRYVPADLPKKSPLVVVLHGCQQTAQAYDLGSGWSTLARERGFAVVYAEQRALQQRQSLFQLVSPEQRHPRSRRGDVGAARWSPRWRRPMGSTAKRGLRHRALGRRRDGGGDAGNLSRRVSRRRRHRRPSPMARPATSTARCLR